MTEIKRMPPPEPIPAEEVAAFAVAVLVRNRILPPAGRLPKRDPGDGFLIEHWRALYAEALYWSKGWEEAYPDPGERVHKIQPNLSTILESDYD